MFDLPSFALQMEFLASAGLLCGIALALVIVWIVIGVWVYRDAESRGMSGVLWLLVVILFGLIGIIIYLIVRGGHPVRPPGGHWPPRAPAYVPPPGYAPPPAYTPPSAPPVATPACRECGAPLLLGAAFCAKCGTKV